MDIIPALDIIGGKVVRLRQGNYAHQTSYATDPLTLAQSFEAAGCTRLHLVDLDGAKAGHPINLPILKTLTEHTTLHIDYSGGLRTEENVRATFDAGAAFICLGSITVESPEQVNIWGQTFGFERIILSADVRHELIQTHGWLQGSEQDIYSYVSSYQALGFSTFCCTDIAKDGMLSGPNFDLYTKLLTHSPGIKVIASGGVTTEDQITALRTLGCHGAIIGKAILDNKLDFSSLFSSYS
jgi:phosphoribosylformimino-5-aminoimidazole carboxamide ribotide isomerase